MAEKFVSERNLKFLLYEVFDTPALTQYPYYADHSRESFDMALETAVKIGKNLMKPKLSEMDKNPPEFIDGRVKVHPVVRALMKECGEGGWIGASFPFDLGGQQLPLMISGACRFILSAANYSASVYPFLTTGAAHLILAFGSREMVETYVPKMFSGEWQGTMALTEPQAGSSLADITTTAEPTDQGYYQLRGQKIFISAGDHDGVDNVIHLMLAKIKGAPSGVRGISLFVVPQKRTENGQLVSNDVNTAGIYHKLGYRGAPITQLSMGENNDCRAYLVGEPHKGLMYMFQMMNEARIDVGLGAAAIASAAYYASLEYAKDRPQGRRLTSKDPTQPQIPIIQHADIRRMLLFQRAVVEGSISLILQCAQYADLGRVLSGEEKEKNELLLDLLTPVAKSYPSEMGIPSVSAGVQILGGYGYCDEFPLEQFYRDARIHPIHEGTTGIQGITLLGRNVTMKNGQAFKLFLEEVQTTIRKAEEVSELEPYARELKEALAKLTQVTLHLIGVAQSKGPEVFLADSTLYLEFFGIVSIAWQWLLQAFCIQKALALKPSATEADFYLGKFYTFRYFFRYELPKIEGLAKRLMDADGLTVELKETFFAD
ncbi:MAG TPA: acyl-CoA dehydrogenase [Thermodesulfobacteriota bacterium]|nr:acyl-CoA dehydrogenase [Thermodesulfobacteriota bacterium]